MFNKPRHLTTIYISRTTCAHRWVAAVLPSGNKTTNTVAFLRSRTSARVHTMPGSRDDSCPQHGDRPQPLLQYSSAPHTHGPATMTCIRCSTLAHHTMLPLRGQGMDTMKRWNVKWQCTPSVSRLRGSCGSALRPARSTPQPSRDNPASQILLCMIWTSAARRQELEATEMP